MTRVSATAATCALLLSACGGLETPVGSVTGHLFGASAGAYVYPLGRPDLKVAVASDGSWALEAVPTSVGALVLYDGADRAELVPLDLEGGADHRVSDRHGRNAPVADALKMPLAGRVFAAALPDGGALPRDLTFTVLGTDHESLPPDAGGLYAATLYPLPAGTFDVAGAMPGFHEHRVGVRVLPGASVSAQLVLDVDVTVDAPGCASSSGCRDHLQCNPQDGRCYECTADSHCEDGEVCNTEAGLCGPATGAATQVCASCERDADCDGAAGLYCVGNSCAPLCAAGCPAGFTCRADGRCKAPNGCSDWFRTMGVACLEDGPCVADLAGGRCDLSVGAPGLCTAPCTRDADCRIGAATTPLTCVGAPSGNCARP